MAFLSEEDWFIRTKISQHSCCSKNITREVFAWTYFNFPPRLLCVRVLCMCVCVMLITRVTFVQKSVVWRSELLMIAKSLFPWSTAEQPRSSPILSSHLPASCFKEKEKLKGLVDGCNSSINGSVVSLILLLFHTVRFLPVVLSRIFPFKKKIVSFQSVSAYVCVYLYMWVSFSLFPSMINFK